MNSPESDLSLEAPPEFESIIVSRSDRRKRIGIRLKNDGTVELLAPGNASESDLRNAFEHFRPWLAKQFKHLAEISAEEKMHVFEFKPGGRFFFCGRSYLLTLAETNAGAVITLQGDLMLTPSAVSGKIKLMLEAFYRRHARRMISDRLERFSREFGFAVSKVNITGARGRFGSCSSKGVLNFSWLLMMYPEELIDLVILHECAHLQEMNHSPAFYKVLGSFLPDHRQRSRELDRWSRKLAGYPH